MTLDCGKGSGRIGVDIGGTFTDVVLEIRGRRLTHKVLTTHDNPATACLEGINRVMGIANAAPGDISVLIHGTTLATNAIIERKGAITSLVTTEGFRDVIEIGTEGRPEQYDINILKPEPLVPRRRRFVVRERLDRDGNILRPLMDLDLEALLPALDACGTESLAIGFIHAYVNPDHEQRARDFLSRRRPSWTISLSSEISPEFREFERFSTTCANAYVQPLISGYLEDFEHELRERGFACPLLLMLSSGGLTSVDTARRFPVRLIESGPAGGAIFAAEVSRRCGIDEAISFDMGGTTAKICMLDGAELQTSRRFEVARVYRFRKDSGLPLRIPVIDMVEIGAGGGSIARLDELERLVVGPESSGSEPGPACYMRGGKHPTVTDACLALGLIDPANFAGGEMILDPEAAKTAIRNLVAHPMGLGTVAAAYGISEVVCEAMASASRVHAIESGKYTMGRTLIAFGGAAPMLACQMADRLGVDHVIIPADAGVGSSVGFLRAPISFELVRTVYQPLGDFDFGTTNAICDAMHDEATRHVRASVGADAPLSVRRHAYMRYRGQGHELAVEVPWEPLGPESGTALQARFDAAYLKAFGRNVGGIAPGEVVTWSLAVSGHRYPDAAIDRGSPPAASTGNGHAGLRPVYDGQLGDFRSVKVIGRAHLDKNAVLDGPAIIVERQTSVVVAAGFEARLLATGDIELRRMMPETRGEDP